MLLMIDNYDSFTYNLVQYFGELGADVRVFRNDEISVEQIAALAPAQIVVSPGPCSPAEAGISVAAIQAFAGKIPLLGVCLGHQSIGAAFGGRIVHAKRLMHGKVSPVHHLDRASSRACPTRSPAPATTRWRSSASLPDCLESPPGPTTARSWACATRPWPSRACSSTPSPSSPSVATTCCATSSNNPKAA
jgi:anthranilate synthase component 2